MSTETKITQHAIPGNLLHGTCDQYFPNAKPGTVFKAGPNGFYITDNPWIVRCYAYGAYQSMYRPEDKGDKIMQNPKILVVAPQDPQAPLSKNSWGHYFFPKDTLIRIIAVKTLNPQPDECIENRFAKNEGRLPVYISS